MKLFIKLLPVAAFVLVYLLFAGHIDGHFWVPFILIAVASSGLGNKKIGKGNLNKYIYPSYMKRKKNDTME